MKQPKPQPTKPARARAHLAKAPRRARPLAFAPPPVQGQLVFDFSLAEKQERTEDNR
jgi:hypothetical protein